MKIDLHCHSKYSGDNHFEPQELIDRAVSINLDGVCFTEHDSVEASKPVEGLNYPDGFLIFRGTEITTDTGHLLAYGLKDDSWNIWSGVAPPRVNEVIEVVHAKGGICAPAHPFRTSDSMGGAIFDLKGIDALETHNGKNLQTENEEALQASKILNIPSIGGSDCHERDHMGQSCTLFTNRVTSMEELVSEIKRGNCRGVKL